MVGSLPLRQTRCCRRRLMRVVVRFDDAREGWVVERQRCRPGDGAGIGVAGRAATPGGTTWWGSAGSHAAQNPSGNTTSAEMFMRLGIGPDRAQHGTIRSHLAEDVSVRDAVAHP
jgi:hypothetical protein